MKIKNLKLMLLGLLAMGSMNAFAADQWAVSNGVRYQYDPTETGKDGTADKPYSATVYGLSAASTTATIPATFSTTDENSITLNFKVTGFEADWMKATAAGTEAKKSRVDATGITTLTIDAKNMGDLSNAFVGLTKLAKLTVSSDNASWTNEGYVTGHLALSDAIKTIEELDLSGLTKVETLAGNFKVSGDNWKKMTKLSLPANLTAIPANCFQDSKVTDLTFTAAKLASIGSEAFKGAALTSIDLSETKVTVIPASAFYEAKALATVTLPADLTEIGAAAFYTTALTSIAIPEKVTTVGAWAFEKCEALATVTGMTKVAEIQTATFRGCKALTAFEVPATVTSIGEDAFKGCEALATFTFATRAADGAALTSIGASAFDGCKALTAIDLSSEKFTFTAIPATWFVGCKALKEIKVSKAITDIEVGAFADAVIEELDLSKTGITALKAIFGKFPTSEKPYKSLKSILLPEGLKWITDYTGTSNNGVFSYCTSLKEITIPASLEGDIPAYAFYYCTKLKTVNYEPTSSTTAQQFAKDAFLGCTPFVTINTNSFYFSANPDDLKNPPTNATFGAADDLSVTPVLDKGKSGKYFAKICPTMNIKISKEKLGDAKLYSVYVDEGIAYFQSLKVSKGYYNIEAGDHVIAKANDATPIEFEIGEATLVSTVSDDFVFSFKETVPTAKFQEHTDWAYAPTYCRDLAAYALFDAGKHYIYALTNSKKNGGFGFTFYTGATLPAGAFFILSTKNPNAEGRLETVWLDEDGNVEGEATAINKIQSKTEDGAIYNLQGVRVNNAKKGIYIKNGKKYIMK